ncbi:MAG: hypothetical protein ACOVO9_07455 [Bacteroidia bacterium]
MKMEKDELDSLLKSKLENNGIPFKESYWIAAQQILLDKRKASKRIYWFFLPSLLALTGIFIYAGNYFTSSVATANTSNKQSVTIITNSTSNDINQTNNLQQKKDQNTENTSINNLADNSSNQTESISKQVESNIKQKENKIAVLSENTNKTSPLTTSINQNINDIDEEDLQVEPNIESLSNQTQENSKFPLLINSLQFTGFKINSNKKPTSELLSISPNKKKKAFISYTSINAGIQLNNQLIPSYYFNGFWHVLANHQLSFYTGIGLFQTTPELGKRTYTESTYGFGESNKSIVINTQKLLYLNVPIGVDFKIKGRHELNLGLSYMYLLSSNDQFYYYENGKMFDTKSKSAHISLFNNQDVLTEINYAYWLNTKSKISIGYFNGLLNISDSKLFENSDKNKNRGFKLGIHYQLN